MDAANKHNTQINHRTRDFNVVRPQDGSYVHRTVLLYYSLREGKHSSAVSHIELKIFSLRSFFSTFMLSLLQHTLPSQSIPVDRYMHAL